MVFIDRKRDDISIITSFIAYSHNLHVGDGERSAANVVALVREMTQDTYEDKLDP